MRSGNAAHVLLEAETRLFGGMGGIGIQGHQKIADFPTHLRITPGDLTWLYLSVHFRLHSSYPRSNLASPSEP